MKILKERHMLTHAQLLGQLAGNTMHVNSVGVALLHILLNFPPPEISEQGHMRKEVSDDVLEFLSVTFEELRHHTSQAARPRPPR